MFNFTSILILWEKKLLKIITLRRRHGKLWNLCRPLINTPKGLSWTHFWQHRPLDKSFSSLFPAFTN
jgi:hypothetical protein